MLREIPLLVAPDMTVHRVDHGAGDEHHDPEEEWSPGYSITFVERGGFSVESPYDSGELHTGDVFVTRPGDCYACRHAERVPDDVCLSITWRTPAIESDDECASLARANRRMIVSRNNRLHYLGWRVARFLETPDLSIAAESFAIELWNAVFTKSVRPLYRERQLLWYADRVEAARELMKQCFADRLTVSGLARAVGMSTFHFCRIFAELTGTPPHAYLLDIRLHSAAAMLHSGTQVTEACFASGFQNLSHFIRMFHRRFGTPPSQYRAI